MRLVLVSFAVTNTYNDDDNDDNDNNNNDYNGNYHNDYDKHQEEIVKGMMRKL